MTTTTDKDELFDKLRQLHGRADALESELSSVEAQIQEITNKLSTPRRTSRGSGRSRIARGGLTTLILKELNAKGAEGVKASELAHRFQVPLQNIYSWFTTAIKKRFLGKIEKSGKGTFRATEEIPVPEPRAERRVSSGIRAPRHELSKKIFRMLLEAGDAGITVSAIRDRYPELRDRNPHLHVWFAQTGRKRGVEKIGVAHYRLPADKISGLPEQFQISLADKAAPQATA
jgi:hypothetical protein